MKIELNKVKTLSEVNSCYVEGELSRRFKLFAHSYDSLGLSVDGIRFNFENKEQTAQEEDVADVVEAQTEEDDSDIPPIWVLVNDDPTFPLFVPIKTDEHGTDYEKAVVSYGLDIMILKTDFTERKRRFRLTFNGEHMEKTGNLREIHSFIIDSFAFPEVRKELLKQLEDCEHDKVAVSSFLVEVPINRIHVLLSLES